MDQQRLFIAIAISVAILLGFQLLVAPHLPQPPKPAPQIANQATALQAPATPAQSAPAVATQTVPREVPRVQIAAPRLHGSISLLGACLDDLVLNDYHETLAPDSPNVRLLDPRSGDQPYYVQYGWNAAPGEQVKLPGNDTVWTSSGRDIERGAPGYPLMGQRRGAYLPAHVRGR